MFGICLKRKEQNNGLIEYVPFLKELSYSQHVKHAVPVTTSVWSESLLNFARKIPEMYSPYLNLEKYLISPDTKEKEQIASSTVIGEFAQQSSVNEIVISKFKEALGEDIHKDVLRMNTHGIHVRKFEELIAEILPTFDRSKTASYYSSRADNPLLSFCKRFIINLREVSIVPAGSSYSDILKIAIKVLEDSWNHNNIISVCCAIADADESSFRDVRSAIYEVKPELKGTLKKTEDINDLDLDLFSIKDFMKEEYEFALINSMLNEIILEEDFLKTCTEVLREHRSSDNTCSYSAESKVSEYIVNSDDNIKDMTVYAFLKLQSKPFYKNYDFNPFDYQICADPGLENMWIIEYSIESKYQFKLYPLDNDANHEEFLSKIGELKHDFYELSDKSHTNSIERDRDKICTFTNNSNFPNSIPINLNASQIDKLISNGTNKILSVGKFGVTQSTTFENRFTKVIPTENLKKIVPSAEIAVNDIEFLSYFCEYDPILKDDPTIVEIKELIKGFGFSVPTGNKDVITKRLAEVMANRYIKVEHDISKMFNSNMIIVKGPYHKTNKEVDICKMLDRDIKSKIISMPKNRNLNAHSNFVSHSNRCIDLIYPCFIVAYIMMHTYAGSIFMPSYKNRLITPKGCFDDLVFRSWGHGESIMLIEASGIGQYSNE